MLCQWLLQTNTTRFNTSRLRLRCCISETKSSTHFSATSNRSADDRYLSCSMPTCVQHTMKPLEICKTRAQLFLPVKRLEQGQRQRLQLVIAQYCSSTIYGVRYSYGTSMEKWNRPSLSFEPDYRQNGDWVCLKNLHLVVAWLPSLEKELSALEPHPEFRLWLTTEPHDEFPPLLLQQSLKVTIKT